MREAGGSSNLTIEAPISQATSGQKTAATTAQVSDSTIAGDEEIGAGSYTGAKIVVAEENGGRSLDENQGSSSIDDEGGATNKSNSTLNATR